MDDTKDKYMRQEVEILKKQIVDYKSVVDFYLAMKDDAFKTELDCVKLKEDKTKLENEISELEIQKRSTQNDLDRLKSDKGELLMLITKNTEEFQKSEKSKEENKVIFDEINKKTSENMATMAQNRLLVEKLELAQKPMYMYVRFLQEVADKKGLKINIIEELKKANV